MNLMMTVGYLAASGTERDPIVQRIITIACIVGAVAVLVGIYIILTIKYIDRIS